jgi:molybdenum cofactor guanylyltransferase
MSILTNNITAMILAGGQGSRMGGQDKGLVKLGRKTMIEHVIAALKPQAAGLILNANRNIPEYENLGYTVISDDMQGFNGPLAGILAGLDHIRTPYLLCAPCDVPGLPEDMGLRLCKAMEDQQGELAVVHDGEHLHPTCALVPKDLREDLRAYLLRGERKLRSWCQSHRLALADYSEMPERFTNINNASELLKFEKPGF